MNAAIAIGQAKKDIAEEFETWRGEMLATKRRACMEATSDTLVLLLEKQVWTRFQLDAFAEQLKELVWILGYAPYLKKEG